jgi:beta-1,4-mannosyltransferase
MTLKMLATSSRNRAGANPFPSLWTDAVQSAGVQVTAYSRRAAVLCRFDILHIHWPEVLINVSRPSLRATLRAALNLSIIFWVKMRGAKVVWTVHNLQPHDSPDNRYNKVALKLFRSLVDEFWVLSSSSERLLRPSLHPRARIRVIPHPSYPLNIESIPSPTRGSITSFGEVRPYRGYVELCEDFGRTAPRSTKLTIIGAGRSDSYARLLRAEVEKHDNVEWLDARLPDIELEGRIAESEAVVLRYNRVTNSGSVLLALSLHRPVVVPKSDAFVELATEVGPGWIHFYSGDLAADIAATRGPKAAEPDLSRRSWQSLGARVQKACVELSQSRVGQGKTWWR